MAQQRLQLCIRTLADSLAALSQKLASRSTVPCRIPSRHSPHCFPGYLSWQPSVLVQDLLPISAGGSARLLERSRHIVARQPRIPNQKKERFITEAKLQRCSLLTMTSLADSLAAFSQKTSFSAFHSSMQNPVTAQPSLLPGVACLAAICPGSGLFAYFSLRISYKIVG